MPLPVGHALAGIGLQQLRPRFFFASAWLDALCFMFLANLPDADFIPGLLLGRPNLYHHGIFHSLGAAVAVAALGAELVRLRQGRFWRAAAMIFLLFFSHLLLDYFAIDLVAPYGLPLLWPFSGRYYIAAWPFFLNITRSPHAADFLASMFNRHNLAAALREIVIVGGVALAMLLLRLRRPRVTRAGRVKNAGD
jgi:inner membrane protein